jgi:catechol 2,3-dioxygenase-like lactoylglutathione lyase family enzyme
MPKDTSEIIHGKKNPVFEIRGVNHLALVSSDMARTVDFYSNVLGMPLVKTIKLPHGGGQHFFFDIGNGDCLAFFWFPDAPPPSPGVASPRYAFGLGPGRPDDILTAQASMNHIAFDVPPERIDEYREKLAARGIRCSVVVNHDDSEMGVSKERTESTFVRSIYFLDPDGIMLEFAAWTRRMTDGDVRHEPASPTPSRASANGGEAAGAAAK